MVKRIAKKGILLIIVSFILLLALCFIVFDFNGEDISGKAVNSDDANKFDFTLTGRATTENSCEEDECGGCPEGSMCMAVGQYANGDIQYECVIPCEEPCPNGWVCDMFSGNCKRRDDCENLCGVSGEICCGEDQVCFAGMRCLENCDDTNQKRCLSGECCPLDQKCLPDGTCGICQTLLCGHYGDPIKQCCEDGEYCNGRDCDPYVGDLCEGKCPGTGSGKCCLERRKLKYGWHLSYCGFSGGNNGCVPPDIACYASITYSGCTCTDVCTCCRKMNWDPLHFLCRNCPPY